MMNKQRLSSFLICILYALLMSIPAIYVPHALARKDFVAAFVTSLGISFFIIWLSRKSCLLKLLLFSIIYLLFVVELFTILCFGSRLGPNMITLILQTNTDEAGEFLHYMFLQTKPLIILVVGLSIYIVLFMYLSKIKFDFHIKKQYYYLLVCIMACCAFFQIIPGHGLTGDNTIMLIYHSVIDLRNVRGEVKVMERMIDKISINPQQNEDSPMIVLIIGESFNKHHSSLYDYYLPTNPKLGKEKNLIIFENVKTPACVTYGAMRYIFTLKSCDVTDGDSTQYILFPAVFKKAGYKVGYFDNQYTMNEMGTSDYQCSYFLSTPQTSSGCFDVRNSKTCKYDGDFVRLCKPLFLYMEKSLNIIHLMGQHIQARWRYPSGFDVFTRGDIKRTDLNDEEKQRVAEYDNACLYNDSVICMIIDLFRDKDAVVVYLSDHGDNVYDGDNHKWGRVGNLDDNESKINLYQIPFMIWCSDKYIEKRPYAYSKILNAKEKPFCCDDVPFLLFDLASIDFNYSNPHRSVINDGYSPHKSLIER